MVCAVSSLQNQSMPLGLFSLYKLEKITQFVNNEAVECYFEEIAGFHYKQGVEFIKHRWEKCIFFVK